MPPLTDMVWEMHENRLFYEIFYRSKGIDVGLGSHLVRRLRSIDSRMPGGPPISVAGPTTQAEVCNFKLGKKSISGAYFQQFVFLSKF